MTRLLTQPALLPIPELHHNSCMGSIAERNEGLKTHWRNLSARARLGECFGFIDALAILYKGGFITRASALEMLNRRASREELAEYRRIRQLDPIPEIE
jgi:hypothetical protein